MPRHDAARRAAANSVLALANVVAVDGAARQRTLLELGWVQLVAVYLWIKAARVWYWPMPDRQPRAEEPGTAR